MFISVYPGCPVYFVDPSLKVAIGQVIKVESNQAIVRNSDGALFSGHVDFLVAIPDEATDAFPDIYAA